MSLESPLKAQRNAPELTPEQVEAALQKMDRATVDRIVTRRFAAELLGVEFGAADTHDISNSTKLVEGMMKYQKEQKGSLANDIQRLITQSVLQNLLNAEMDQFLQYKRYDRLGNIANTDALQDKDAEAIATSPEGTSDASPADGKSKRKGKRNYRNGSYSRNVRTEVGDITVSYPRERNGAFNSALLPKGSTDFCGSREQILNLAAMGNSVRDIATIFKDMLHCDVSHEYVQGVMDSYHARLREWQERELRAFYPFIFIDCTFLPIRQENGRVAAMPAYVILGIDMAGKKELLALEIIGKDEKRSDWMNVIGKLQNRGVKDMLFVCMDGVKGVDKAIKAIFPHAITQRCMVHMMRNSTQYISTKNRAEFCRDAKRLYKADDLNGAIRALGDLAAKWKDVAPLAVKVWETNFEEHVAPLYDFAPQIRRIIYTTNPIESVNSSLKEVVKKGCYNSPESALTAMLLRSDKVLATNWQRKAVHGWSQVLNQLLTHEATADIVRPFVSN